MDRTQKQTSFRKCLFTAVGQWALLKLWQHRMEGCWSCASMNVTHREAVARMVDALQLAGARKQHDWPSACFFWEVGKSISLEVGKSRECWKSGNPHLFGILISRNYGINQKHIKVKTSVNQNDNKVWISTKQTLPAPCHAISSNFLRGPKKSKHSRRVQPNTITPKPK